MIDVPVPLEQEGTKAIVRNWLKKPGEHVRADEPLVELETDKVTQEVAAPGEGILEFILLETGAEALPGALLGKLREIDAASSLPEAPAAPPAAGHPVSPVQGSIQKGRIARGPAAAFLSPSVRRAVREHAIDVDLIDGTGRGGRITRADIEQHLAERASRSAATPPVPTPADSATPAPVNGAMRSVPHDGMRLAIARNMLGSVTAAPHVTAVFEADFSAIIAHRERHKAEFLKAGARLTFTAYLMAAAAEAMKVAPAINSRWHEDRLDIFESIHIGIGTALGDKGLVVPVVSDVQELSLLGIARRLTDITDRARDGRITPAELRGGTFTISNHGVSGSLLATPIIIVQPQSAILGVGKLEKRVVVREVGGIDTIQIRPLSYVSLTIDHRVVDGHQTNLWLARFVEVIENWPLEG